MKAREKIEQNIKAHNRIYDKYEQTHCEIFNQIEQDRLHKKLEQAVKTIKTNSDQKIAFDYGCGSGNLTRHLIDCGLYTIAGDVSERLLSLTTKKYSHTGMLDTIKINGQDLSDIEDSCFDLVGTYSVLHHVPDYLKIIKEMIRVMKHGGVIYIDHEVNESYWNNTGLYQEFLNIVQSMNKKSWKRYLKLSNYIYKIRVMINPKYRPEGDIHVFPDDHIEWDKIEKLLTTHDCEIVLKEDYLAYSGYPLDIYRKYEYRCADMRVLIAIKK